jgi:thioredoxin-like negative regulator of GroEL
MTATIPPIDESTFPQDVLTAALPVVVDVGAPWCYYCRLLDPVLETVAGDYQGHFRFFKMDSDASPSLSTAYHISTVPTLLLIHKGHLLDRETEAFKPAEVRALLDRWRALVASS